MIRLALSRESTNYLQRTLAAFLQTEVGQSGMIVGPPPQGPVIFSILLGDRQVIDAGDPPAHQAVIVEFPVLVAVGAEPVPAVVMPFIGKPHGNPVFSICP